MIDKKFVRFRKFAEYCTDAVKFPFPLLQHKSKGNLPHAINTPLRWCVGLRRDSARRDTWPGSSTATAEDRWTTLTSESSTCSRQQVAKPLSKLYKNKTRKSTSCETHHKMYSGKNITRSKPIPDTAKLPCRGFAFGNVEPVLQKA